MNEKTKETVSAVARVAFPTLGALVLLAIVVAGGGLCIGSLIGMLLVYDPSIFAITFTVGFVVAAVGTFELSKRLFLMGEEKKATV